MFVPFCPTRSSVNGIVIVRLLGADPIKRLTFRRRVRSRASIHVTERDEEAERNRAREREREREREKGKEESSLASPHRAATERTGRAIVICVRARAGARA